MKPPRLTVELVPSGTWGVNVRSHVRPCVWRAIQRECFAKASTRCEVCGARGTMHCHEVWQYDDDTRVQRLTGVVCLCAACHEVKHIGLAMVNGRLAAACAHLAAVNGWDRPTTEAYVAGTFALWQQRQLRAWTVEMKWLDQWRKKHGE